MGFISKSIIVLAIALAIPLAYKKLVDDKTVANLSKHIPNYKVIDKYLRQSAHEIEKANTHYTEIVIQNYEKIKPKIVPFLQSLPKRFDYITQTVQVYLKEHLKLPTDDRAQPQEQQQSKKTKTSTQQTVPSRNANLKKEQAGKVSNKRLVKCSTDKTLSPSKQLFLFSKQELQDETTGGKLYLAFTGLVYDVSSNSEKYGQGAEYSFFAGRDGTRAYVTGNFTDDLNDNISDLDESKYSRLHHWASFYQKSYPLVGRVEGAFFDADGCPTAETKGVQAGFEKLLRREKEGAKVEVLLPECNSEFNADTKKSRVWCSKASGGIERSWVGSPRIYHDSDGSKRCVCYSKKSNVDAELAKKLKRYSGCEVNSFECHL